MDATGLSPFERELATFLPSPADALEKAIIESLRLRAARRMENARQIERIWEEEPILFELSDAHKEQIALIKWEDVVPNISERSEPPTIQPRKKEPSPWAAKLSKLLPYIGFLVLAVAVVHFQWQEQQQTLLEVSEKPTTPAVMTDLADVQWKGTAPKLGEPLQPGQLAFESGTVELLFYNGVRSVIEGPADLILMNQGQVFCRRGNWSVTVPPSGVGFEIQTPGGTIRDLGTQFFASIDGKNCDVHVVKGAVEVENGREMVLKTNQAVRVRGSEILDRIPSVADLFVAKTEMRRRSAATLPPTAATQSPALSVDFSQKNPEGVTLYSGSRENGAFRFMDAESRIRLQPLGKLSSFTVLIGIRIDRLNSGLNPILTAEGSKPGGLVWHITPQGTMVFGLLRRAGRESQMFETPVVFTEDDLNEWGQIALSVDEHRGRMSVFFNGDPIGYGKLLNSAPLDLSKLDIGNWKPNTGQKSGFRQLDGAVESITVFDRALDSYELRMTSYE